MKDFDADCDRPQRKSLFAAESALSIVNMVVDAPRRIAESLSESSSDPSKRIHDGEAISFIVYCFYDRKEMK